MIALGKFSPANVGVGIVALALVGCANPVQQDIVTFGEAAGILASATSGVYSRHRILVDENNVEQAVIDYSSREKSDFIFPPSGQIRPVDEAL